MSRGMGDGNCVRKSNGYGGEDIYSSVVSEPAKVLRIDVYPIDNYTVHVSNEQIISTGATVSR